MKTRFYIPLANIEQDPDLVNARVDKAEIHDGELVLTIEHESKRYQEGLTLDKHVAEPVPVQATAAEQVTPAAVPRKRSPQRHRDTEAT